MIRHVVQPGSFALILLGAPALAQSTAIASVDSAGVQANFACWEAAISADGRFVAFRSGATGLVPGDTNGSNDVFVRDLSTGTTERASVSSTGEQGNNYSTAPSISADGRFVAFGSVSDNLFPFDANPSEDIFVRDRLLGTTEVVSLVSGGGQAWGNSTAPAISADGRYVAFESYASNLVPGDTNVRADVFVRDRVGGTTTRVSVGAGGVEGSLDSFSASISADGRYVAFESPSSNLVPPDTNNAIDVFVHDLATGVTTRVSVDSNGAEANLESRCPALSADGRLVAFDSLAGNLIPADSNGVTDVFVHDRTTGTTTRVSVSSTGLQGNLGSADAAISADGRHVVFWSTANNLIAGDTNQTSDAFVHDRWTGMTRRVSLEQFGSQANGPSFDPSISADGRRVAFRSSATNLVSGDTNGEPDVFVRDRGPVSTYGTGKVNSLGCLPEIESSGTPSASTGSGFSVLATAVLNNKPGILLYSTNGPASAPFHGGTLYLESPIRRTPAQGSGGTPPPAVECDGTYAFDFNAWITSGVDPALVTGQSVWCQYYARDPGFAPPDNVGLSNALELTIQP